MGELSMRYNGEGFRPFCLPLDERPIPRILENFLRNNAPYGYGYALSDKIASRWNHYNMTYQHALYIVAETFEAPDGPELMLRYFATRNTVKRDFEITEIMRECPAENYCYYRNAYFRQMAGWNYIYRDEEKKTRGGYYGYNYTIWEKGWFNKWMPESWKKVPGFSAYWINPELVTTIPRYQYSGWRRDLPVIAYLKWYRENPGIEFFGKLDIMPTKALVNKALKDGNFRRFIRDNAKKVSLYGSSITLHVYRHREKSFEDAYEEINAKSRAARQLSTNCWEAKDLPKGTDKTRVWEYARHVGARNYNDYLNAVKYLDLDLTDTKVLFPNDFMRMHDLRINEAAAVRAQKDAEKAKVFAESFAKAAVDYAFANYAKPDDAYVVLIPVAKKDLVSEGEALKHCVGKMGYDNRMIAHKSFIAFLRKADEVDKPFVTIEFNIECEKIVQIYGAQDSKPDEDVIEWSKTWENAVREILITARKAIAKEIREGTQKHKDIFEYIREAKLAA